MLIIAHKGRVQQHPSGSRERGGGRGRVHTRSRREERADQDPRHLRLPSPHQRFGGSLILGPRNSGLIHIFLM